MEEDKKTQNKKKIIQKNKQKQKSKAEKDKYFAYYDGCGIINNSFYLDVLESECLSFS